MAIRRVTMTFQEIAGLAGFHPEPDGKLNIPATQASADKLASVVNESLGQWQPGEPKMVLTLTGAGPVWGYLAIAHACHGRCAQLIYAAPNATISVWNHGLPA